MRSKVGYLVTEVRKFRGYEGTGVRGYENSLEPSTAANTAAESNLAPPHPRTPYPRIIPSYYLTITKVVNH